MACPYTSVRVYTVLMCIVRMYRTGKEVCPPLRLHEIGTVVYWEAAA